LAEAGYRFAIRNITVTAVEFAYSYPNPFARVVQIATEDQATAVGPRVDAGAFVSVSIESQAAVTPRKTMVRNND
jgi:hypothetical protein